MRATIARCLLLAALAAAASPAAEGPATASPPLGPPVADPTTDGRRLLLRLRAAPDDELRRRMHGWHDGYRQQISPVVREWRLVSRAADLPRPAETLATGCRRLGTALAGIDRRRLLSAPDPSVSLHLEEGLRALAEAARSCTRGAYFLTAWRLRQADGSWAELGGRLGVYGLAP